MLYINTQFAFNLKLVLHVHELDQYSRASLPKPRGSFLMATLEDKISTCSMNKNEELG